MKNKILLCLLFVFSLLNTENIFAQDLQDKVLKEIMKDNNFKQYCKEMHELSELYHIAIMKMNEKEYETFSKRYEKGGYYYSFSIKGLTNKEIIDFQEKHHEKTIQILDSVHYSGNEAKKKHRNKLDSIRDVNYLKETTYMEKHLNISQQDVEHRIIKATRFIVEMDNIFMKYQETITNFMSDGIEFGNKFLDALNSLEKKEKNKCLQEFKKYVNVNIMLFFIGKFHTYQFFKKELAQLNKHEIIQLHLSFMGLAEYYRNTCAK